MGVDFVEVTFSAAAQLLDTTLTDFADGAACVFEGLNSRALKE